MFGPMFLYHRVMLSELIPPAEGAVADLSSSDCDPADERAGSLWGWGGLRVDAPPARYFLFPCCKGGRWEVRTAQKHPATLC